MSKLDISKKEEAQAVARIREMGIQSLSPDVYKGLVTALKHLRINRHLVDIDVLRMIVSNMEDTYPKGLRPVLAKIEHINDLGKSSWYEVVYYEDLDTRWCSYSGSKTFDDGEQVISWKHADECL